MGVTEGDLQLGLDLDVALENCTIPYSIPGTYLTKDQPPPSNFVCIVYSTIQCSTIEIMI